MKASATQEMKQLFFRCVGFMLPAMLIAAKGFADLWIASGEQPYLAWTLLLVSVVTALLYLTIASAMVYLSTRQFWMPPAKLILMITGMILYFDFSLGRTLGLIGLAAPVGLWFLWGILAYRKKRNALEGHD